MRAIYFAQAIYFVPCIGSHPVCFAFRRALDVFNQSWTLHSLNYFLFISSNFFNKQRYYIRFNYNVICHYSCLKKQTIPCRASRMIEGTFKCMFHSHNLHAYTKTTADSITTFYTFRWSNNYISEDIYILCCHLYSVLSSIFCIAMLYTQISANFRWLQWKQAWLFLLWKNKAAKAAEAANKNQRIPENPVTNQTPPRSNTPESPPSRNNDDTTLPQTDNNPL